MRALHRRRDLQVDEIAFPHPPLTSPLRLGQVKEVDQRHASVGINAIDFAEQQAAIDGVDEVMVIGGETLYRQCLEDADRLYLTRIESAPDGDAWFPELDAAQWLLVSERAVAAGMAFLPAATASTVGA